MGYATSLTANIELFSRRVGELRGASRAPGTSSERLLEESLAELGTSLEELKVAQEELTEQNQRLSAAHAQVDVERRRYQDLFMTAPFAMLMTDNAAVIQEANSAAVHLLGAGRADALAGKPLPFFAALPDRDRFQQMARMMVQNADLSAADEFSFREISLEQVFPCRVTVARASSLGSDRLCWTLVDLTDRERARDCDRLEAQTVRRDEFIATLGHELRNPLAAIALAAELLDMPLVGDQPPPGQAIQMIQRQSKQLGRLVDDLLDASRLVHGKIELHCQPVNLGEVVATAIEVVHPIIRTKEHILTVHQIDDVLWVHVDYSRLVQVVANLLDNAAKYSRPCGLIEVRLRQQDDQVVLSVRDFGIGISGELRERIFGMFEQGMATTSAGLGIGLTVVRELVVRHGGTVEAFSQGPGHGSEFVVRLPVTARPPAVQADARAGDDVRPGTRPSEEGLRVLIVDDNVDAAELLGLRLQSFGHAVQVATTAGAAAKMASASEVALVDLGIPDEDGFQIARRHRAARPGIRLIALTGFADERNRSAARRAGFEAYRLKPVAVADLDVLLRAGRFTR